MANPFDDESATYFVLVNHEGGVRPAGGQIERLDLTMPVVLPEDGSHDEASIAQRGIQAAGC
jgi:hypothetical protein